MQALAPYLERRDRNAAGLRGSDGMSAPPPAKEASGAGAGAGIEARTIERVGRSEWGEGSDLRGDSGNGSCTQGYAGQEWGSCQAARHGLIVLAVSSYRAVGSLRADRLRSSGSHRAAHTRDAWR